MVIFLVLDDVVEDSDGALVAEILQLLAVVGDVAALFDLKPAQGHADAAGTIGEGVGLAAGVAVVNGLRTTQFDDAAVPEGSVLPLGAGEVAQNLGTDGIAVAVGEGVIGVVALHFGLPIGFEGGQALSSTWRCSG